jgi:hypothetical protein
MHWRTALQIWQSKGRLAIATVGGAEQREERRILTNRHELAIAERPTFRRKIEGEDSDFGYKRIGHDFYLSFSLVLRREDSLERDAEVQHQVRLHVRVWLAAAEIAYGLGRHRGSTYSAGAVGCLAVVRPIIARGRSYRCVCRRRLYAGVSGKIMHVGWKLALRKSVVLLAGLFSERVAAAFMKRHTTAQVRQRKCSLAIAPVCSAEQCEESLVLVDGQQLAVAHRPAPGWVIKTHDANFGHEWL